MGQVTLDHVSKRFGAVEVIRDVSLTVEDGEFVVFVGPSGCGKSSLLRLITGLEELSDGRVMIDGKDVSALRPSERKLAMVFQSYALFPHMSVRDNISFGLRIAGESREKIDQKVAEASRILELNGLLDRMPRELSGGQRQRVAIGRAIVRAPTAFLFDEPLSNLDAALRVQMRLELIKLHASLRTTMIYVTHDQVEAMTMADRIVVLNAGRIEQFDTPIALYDRPENLFVAGFIGSPKMNLFPVEADGAGAIRLPGGKTLAIPGVDHPRMTRSMTFGIRPEHLAHDHARGLWEGMIVVAEQLGSDAFFTVQVENIGTLTVRAVGERGYRTGDRIFLTPAEERIQLFDDAGRSLMQRAA